MQETGLHITDVSPTILVHGIGKAFNPDAGISRQIFIDLAWLESHGDKVAPEIAHLIRSIFLLGSAKVVVQQIEGDSDAPAFFIQIWGTDDQLDELYKMLYYHKGSPLTDTRFGHLFEDRPARVGATPKMRAAYNFKTGVAYF